MRAEHPRDTSKTSGATGRADKQKRLAAQFVDQRHADHGEQKVGCADRDGLLVARDLTESSSCKDVVQVIENRVDACELVEGADGDSEKKRIAVLPAKYRLVSGCVFLSKRGTDIVQLCLRVGCAHELEHRECFVVAIVRGGPARAARNAEE